MNRTVVGTFALLLAFMIAACAQPEPTQTSTPVSSPTPQPPTSTPRPTATATPLPTATPTPAPLSSSDIAMSAVRIDAFIKEEGKLVRGWSGSGTIITADGQILTNAHVVDGAEKLVINLNTNVDLPPVPAYLGELVMVDPVMDLALVQITSDYDGNDLSPGDLDLAPLEVGDSDSITFGEAIRILGFPGVGGETVTLTEGKVSGFESMDLGMGMERVWIKTDTTIAPGNSGGIAVNEDGLLIGIPSLLSADIATLGRLRPVNLRRYLGDCPPLICEALIYEPNDDFPLAYGPLESGDTYTAYLHQFDLDVYRFKFNILAPLEINLTGIAPEVDYDLFLFDSAEEIVAFSDSENDRERIIYTPETTGTYFVVVLSWDFATFSLTDPYHLQVAYDGDAEDPGTVTVSGRLVNADTGRPLEGVYITLLLPGITGQEYFDSNGDDTLVQVWSISDADGLFILENVPRGQSYTAVVVLETNVIWQDEWLILDANAPDDIEVGDITVSTE